jgi:flagellin-like protein
MNGRGVTPVLGLVLLVGITVAGSMAIFVVGASLIGDSQEQVQATQVESSTVGVAKRADDLHAGKRTNATFSYEGSGEGRPRVEPDAGRLNITQYVDGEAKTVLIDDKPLGALVYERGRREYAYQSGGVWERSRSGRTRLIRNPSVRYGNGMLSFSFINVTGEGGLDSETGTMSLETVTDRFPTQSTTNPLENGTVMIELESRYCDGWETHFRQQTSGAIVETCRETGETNRGELRVELIVPFEFEGTSPYAVIANDVDKKGNPTIGGGGVKLGHDYPSASRLVERKVDACSAGEGNPITGDTVDEPGLHCIGSMDRTTQYTFDTSNGDIAVAVDGPASPGGIEIIGNGEVTLFMNGSLFGNVAGNFEIGEPGAAEQLTMFVHSEYDVGDKGGGKTSVHGFLYAPNSELDIRGTPEFEGAMVIDNLTLAGNAKISYDADAASKERSFDAGGSAVYYLHIDESRVEFNDDR